MGVASFGGGGILGPNEYSLQLNTNSNSTTSACSGGAPGCTVWQQFIYGDASTSGSKGVFISYWLLGYGADGASCPSGYQSSKSSCFKNSSSVSAPDVPITGLGNLKLAAAVVSGGNDTVTFANGTTALQRERLGQRPENSHRVEPVGIQRGWRCRWLRGRVFGGPASIRAR